jgi:hypothetical protein
MIPILKALRQLLGYAFFAYLLLDTPLGVFFLVQFLFIKKYPYCFYTWYVLDIFACHVFHSTGSKRTISGWTGQHMHKSRRYYYQAKVIDFGFGKDHCFNTYLSELEKGNV